jgi:transcriptional regulator with XRE-family HTH domain
MRKTYTDIISELLDEKITSYRLAQETGLSVQLLDKYRHGKSNINNMTLEKAERLVNFALSESNDNYFDADYDVFLLEGNLDSKKKQIYEAFFDFVQSNKLQAKIFTELSQVLENLHSETIHDSEHLYLSFENIADGAVENEEIPTGGDPDNGKEAVVKCTSIDTDSNQRIYILFTYDV